MLRPTLLISSVILMILESLSFLGIIKIQQYLIDDILIQGQYEKIPLIVCLFVVAFFLYALLFTFGPHFMHKNQAAIQECIANDFMKYLYKIPVELLQKERTATYVHYLTQDLDKVAFMMGNQLPKGIQQIFTTILVAAMIGLASPIMLLICFVLGVVYVSLGKVFSLKLKKAASEVQYTKSKVLVHIEQGISSTREVLAYHRLEWEKKRYDSLYGIYYKKVMDEGKLVNLKMITTEPLNWGVRVLIIGYGGFLVLQGKLSIGMFVVIFQLGFQFIQCLQDLFNTFMDWFTSSASLERLSNVMNGEENYEGKDPVPLPLKSISFKNIDFGYQKGGELILKKLSFEISLGRKIAIVGPSGSGKSSISLLLIRYFNPESGNIIVNNQPLQQIKREEWNQYISIVFQDPYFFPDTIHNNLLMGLDKHKEDNLIKTACKVAQIDEYIMSLPDKYNTVIGERGITLSGGQRQRLAIARALIQNKEILILDEATSALDMNTEKKIQREIDSYRSGKTTIIIAHRLSTIKNADLILVLQDGQIIEQGNHDQLVNIKGLYQKMVSHQEINKEDADAIPFSNTKKNKSK
ncbi:ABC transporter ATP-binding protein [Paenibacillus sp. CFBP13512]|uniref:ABC transporter ATP-binding protein n=1 Tax=Paenibacillus sp. CFBP13512 TaxID=2184007 RepID=UPI0010C0EB13|nr:ABC transporter ATP-binding protein [Paenibacillus sp. CFBP13512]